MDQILHRVYEIEEAAEAIRTGAEEQKKARAEQMRKRTADFDARLEKETAEAIEKLRGTVTERNREAIEEQQRRSQMTIDGMQQEFDRTHSEVAEALFRELIRPEEYPV